MNYGMSLVKYLLFIFNFIFTLLGLIIAGVGIWFYVNYGDLSWIHSFTSLMQILFIVLGVVIFTIAFFGCCGAIRENDCMIITFALFLLIILFIQIGIGTWVFVSRYSIGGKNLGTHYQKIFDQYWNEKAEQTLVDTLQSNEKCCGVNSYADFVNSGNGSIPSSCCGDEVKLRCTKVDAYKSGCVTALTSIFKLFAEVIGGITISLAVIEIIGITLAFCLANSLTKYRRGYMV